MINLFNSNYKNTKKNTKNNNTKNNNTKKNTKKNSTLKHLSKKSYIKKLKHSSKNKKKIYKPRSVEKYCTAFYKFDINGKINKNLYNSCKIHKYCRKNKCKNIDEKMIKEQEKIFGPQYNNLIQGMIRQNCPLTISKKNKIKCEKKVLKNIYKEYKMEDLYDKLNECDKKTCIKEKQIFYNNLFRKKEINLKKRQRLQLAQEKLFEEPDMYLIKNGDI
jgi:hypothetical protein